jgi:hypothetical protein
MIRALLDAGTNITRTESSDIPGYMEPSVNNHKTAGRQEFEKIAVDSIALQHALGGRRFANQTERVNGRQSIAAIRPAAKRRQKSFDQTAQR